MASVVNRRKSEFVDVLCLCAMQRMRETSVGGVENLTRELCSTCLTAINEYAELLRRQHRRRADVDAYFARFDCGRNTHAIGAVKGKCIKSSLILSPFSFFTANISAALKITSKLSRVSERVFYVIDLVN